MIHKKNVKAIKRKTHRQYSAEKKKSWVPVTPVSSVAISAIRKDINAR